MIAVLDIGGTSIKYGMISPSENFCEILHSGSTDSNARMLQGPGIVEKAASIIDRFRQMYPIEGIAVSTAGMVDARCRCIACEKFRTYGRSMQIEKSHPY